MAHRIINQVIHSSGDTDFNTYDYTQVLIPAGITSTINGTPITPPTADIVLDLFVRSAVGNVFLLGMRKVETTFDYNSDGTISIK